jgi:putative GTP pyrophosphokinase
MEALHREVRELKSSEEEELTELHLAQNHFNIPIQLTEMVNKGISENK